MSKQEQTVVVIGSNSFSGSDFVDHLLETETYRVLGISRSPEKGRLFLPYLARNDLGRFTFHQLDLNRDFPALRELLETERPRYVVNFASQSEVAPSWEHPEQWFRTNAVAVARLSNFLKDQTWLERYVHISTPEIYGSCNGAVNEDFPMNPSTPYAASRAAGEMMLNTLVKSYDFPVVFVRAANVYGAHQQLFKIIPRCAIYLRMGKTIPLHGGGEQVRSFIHIRDVSRAEVAIMHSGRTGSAYNLSPDDQITIRQVVAAVCAQLGERFEDCVDVEPARVGNDSAYTLDSTKARLEFGWSPRVDFGTGVREVVDWVDAQWEQITREPLEYQHTP